MKISTIVGGAIVFVAGVGTGMCLTCKAAVKIDEKIYKGKLREKFADATAEVTTSFLREKFEPKRFEPKKFEYFRFNSRAKNFCSPNEAFFSSYTEAEETLLEMNDIIERYGWVTIADFYDLVGANHIYRDTKCGWKDGLSLDLIGKDSDGWTIIFPDVCEFK